MTFFYIVAPNRAGGLDPKLLFEGSILEPLGHKKPKLHNMHKEDHKSLCASGFLFKYCAARGFMHLNSF